MKAEYITKITELLDTCDDVGLLDLITQLLLSEQAQKASA